MRPITLTIQAFGAYVQDKSGKPIVIDFTKLGRKGLFLVTGDTGAGKTTIFDAITYALFGRTSGEWRDGSMMRSTYAPADVPTFVELEFEYDGRKYTVRRAPAQMRPKERGEGMTGVSETASLTFEDKSPLTSLKEVNAKLTEILGVDFDQYSQIAMIAQGKFRELLDADTRKRSEIFRSIFRTGNFQTLQNRLKEEAAELYGKVCNERRSVVQYVDGAVCLKETELAAVLDDAKEQVRKGSMPIAEARQIIQNILESDIRAQAANKDELESIREALEKIAADLKVIETYKANIIALDRRTAEKARQETEVKPCLDKAFTEADSHKPDIERLTTEIERMLLVMDNYGKLTECSNGISEISGKYKSAVISRDNETADKERLDRKIREDEAELKSIEDPATRIATISARMTAIEEESGRIDGIGKAYQNYISEVGRLSGLQQTARIREKEWSDRNSEYNDRHRLFIAEQAGYLAEELEEGKPCPVCGSIHHPTPATKAEAAPTKAQLDALWEEVGNLKTQAEKAANAYSAKSGSVTAAKVSLLENAKAIVGEVTVEELPEKLKSISDRLDSEQRSHKASLKELEAHRTRKEQLEKSLPADRESYRTHLEKEGHFKAEADRLQAEEKAQKERLSELKKNLAYDSETEARKALSGKQAEKQRLEKSIEAAREALQKYAQDISAIDGSISQLKEQTRTAPVIDSDTATARQAELKERQKALEVTRDSLNSNVRINHGVLDNIDRTSGKLSALEEEYRWKNSLAQTANGDINGKERISLETYVQMAFFDHILQRANTRLMVMSGGQYELRRSSTSKGKAQAGLDLDVMDHYNGSRRSVKSLSGGESFMASLSLALGLSDEIQASAGGIRLDTMFVDEGFGSLDEESLEQALKALNALTDGDRLIGIISHVAELKKIDRQIVVTKDKMNFSQVSVNA